MTISKSFRNSSENLNYLKKSIMDHINALPKGELHIYHRIKSGKEYISYVLLTPDGKRQYIKKQKELIKMLSKKCFLEIELARLDELICASNAAVEAADLLNATSIIGELPKELRTFLSSAENENVLLIDKRISKEDMSDWKNELYASNNFYANIKSHRTSDGTFVKSKSELIIYEKLLQFGIVFKYEAPLQIGNTTYYPDFTILLPDGKIYYWEHAGMMENENYRMHHKRKMDSYETAGIVPWKNLIVTYDDEDGNLNIPIVESEIRNKLLV